MSEIIILAEVINNTLKESTAEVISAASSLGDSLTVIVPGTSPESAASIASTYEGIERVIALQDDCFANFDPTSHSNTTPLHRLGIRLLSRTGYLYKKSDKDGCICLVPKAGF